MLQVAGTCNLDQIIITLKMCKRATYIQHCLYSLYSMSEVTMLGPRPDILEVKTRIFFTETCRL